jgi:mRNA interferase MazF
MYNQRDIILVNIPFTDFTFKKVRPALIISSNYYNSNSKDTIITAITSNIFNLSQYIEIIDSSSLEIGQLPKKSAIRYDKIYTISKNIILKKFSTLKKDIFNNVIRKINIIFQS